MPPTVEPGDFVVAEKIKGAVLHGDLREVQALFSKDLEIKDDVALIERHSKADSLDAMEHGYFGYWRPVNCGPVRIERTSVSRFKIILFVTYPLLYENCRYPEKSNQIQIYRLTGEKFIKNIDFWWVYG